MPKNKFSAVSEKMLGFLEEAATEAGRRSGFVKRASKLTASGFVKTLVLGLSAKPGASLEELAEQSEELGVSISRQGLDERLTDKAVALLKGLFAEALARFRSEQQVDGAVFSQFNGIHILDSSIITLPAEMQALYAGCKTKGGAAALKVQLSFEYLRGQLSAIEVQAGRSPDQNCQLHVDQASPDSLHLFDLGYFKQEVLASLAGLGAFFISRFQTQTALYAAADSQRLDIASVLATTTAAYYEAMYELGGKVHLPVRFIAQRLPDDVAAQRRRKAIAKFRKKGSTPSDQHLRLLSWNLFITNVPPDRLSACHVVTFYRLRWQIELLFKLWKPHALLDHVGSWRSQRVLAFLYAKLIGLVIFHWLAAPYRIRSDHDLSWPKAFRRWQAAIPKFISALAAGRGLASACSALVEQFLLKARQGSRKKYPSTYRRLVTSGAAL